MTSRTPDLATPEQAVLASFVHELRRGLEDPGVDRNDLCRDLLMQIYYGEERSFAERVGDASASLAARSLAASMDPRNITLEAEYYGEMEEERYYRVKPLLWLWQMFDHSVLGHNCQLAFRVRYLLAQHIFRRIGNNVRFFRGVEFSFGYNMSVGSNVTFHRFVLVDDRGPVEVGDGVSISDWANIYTHSHHVEDIGDVEVRPTVIEDGARVTYHSTVLAGVRLGRHSMLGSMGVATKDIPPYHVNVGIPARAVKVTDAARTDPEFRGPYDVPSPVSGKKD
jgi:acetyltransferase-like isoleucine patch superfamily enzyme